MRRHTAHLASLATIVLLACGDQHATLAQAKAIRLPNPDTKAGRPLMQVLQDRQSQREFRREPSSSKTCTCTARLRGWRRSFAPASIAQRWRNGCSCVRTSGSSSHSPSAIPGAREGSQ